MSQLSSSTKNLNTAQLLLQLKTVKHPFSPKYSELPDTPNSRFNPFKNHNKLSNIFTKTQKISQKGEQIIKRKNNDYVKKIIFQNQQLTKRIKELQQKNIDNQAENRELHQKYSQLRQNFINLKTKYQMLACDNEMELPNKLISKTTKEPNLFTALFRGVSFSSDSQKKKESNISEILLKKDSSASQLALKIKPCLVQSQSQFPTLENRRRQSLFTFKKSHSIHEFNDAQTQTYVPVNDISDSSQGHLSPSSFQSQLLSKIGTYEVRIKQLERQKSQVVQKYQKIKLIIGGDLKIV